MIASASMLYALWAISFKPYLDKDERVMVNTSHSCAIGRGGEKNALIARRSCFCAYKIDHPPPSIASSESITRVITMFICIVYRETVVARWGHFWSCECCPRKSPRPLEAHHWFSMRFSSAILRISNAIDNKNAVKRRGGNLRLQKPKPVCG